MTTNEYMAAAEQVARIAGGMISQWIGGNFTVGTKAEKHDYVTGVDLASEKLVREELRKRFPDHQFFGEEEASADPAGARDRLVSFGPDEYVWFVDPLDGTTNFVRRIPLFCISIALAKGGKILASAVMDPFRNEVFTSALGGGAFLNGQPIRVSATGVMADAILSTSLPTAVHPGRQESLANMHAIFPQISTGRIFNCAALSLAYVAAGRTDGHWEYGLHIWDMAAGVLMITEAGGKVTTVDGSEFSILSQNIICTNGLLQDPLVGKVTASRA